MSIVARVAYETLLREDPTALQTATDLLKTLRIRGHGEQHTLKEGRYPFVECATLADDIKYIGGGWQSEWHFTDIPWFDQGGSPDDYPEFRQDPQNLTSVLPQMVKWLRGESGYEKEFLYETMIRQNYSFWGELTHAQERQHSDDQEIMAKSFGLRLLIHYMGDIHQPLHCSAKVDKHFPKGDKGGNLFQLPNHYSSGDLHAVWDSVLYQYHIPLELVI